MAKNWIGIGWKDLYPMPGVNMYVFDVTWTFKAVIHIQEEDADTSWAPFLTFSLLCLDRSE